MELALRTFREQQRRDGPGPYKFQRVTGWQTDTVAGAGYGNPIRPVGLIVSIFRPSDDATIFPFLVPSNHFAVVSLRQLAEMARTISGREGFASACEALAAEVDAALAAGLPVLKRADLLGHLMEDTIGIAVAGSHGKTTTTGMISQILMTAGLDPTIVVGGVLPALGSNGRYGEGGCAIRNSLWGEARFPHDFQLFPRFGAG